MAVLVARIALSAPDHLRARPAAPRTGSGSSPQRHSTAGALHRPAFLASSPLGARGSQRPLCGPASPRQLNREEECANLDLRGSSPAETRRRLTKPDASPKERLDNHTSRSPAQSRTEPPIGNSLPLLAPLFVWKFPYGTGCPGMTCTLCAIAVGNEPANVSYEGDDILAIAPLRPSARVHILIFPREHLADLPALLTLQPHKATAVVGCPRLANRRGLSKTGSRLVWNYVPDTHQRIGDPHLQLVGGEDLQGVQV